jgi:blue copper oxidase
MNKATRFPFIMMLAIICFRTVANAQPFTQPLHIMDTLSGTTFNLNLQQGSHQFYPGVNTGTYGYNGSFFGPTLILNHGDSVVMNVTNNLVDTTTTHWHGLHVPAHADGGPHQLISPGQTWSPSFKVLDKAATYWYHPHLHTTTEKQVTKGAVGLIIVRDNEEATKALPRTYGVDDIPLVIQSKIINQNNNQIVLQGVWDTNMTINGVIKPYVNVPAQPVRFRLLNGSSRRVYMLGLSDNGSFYQVATDGSLTPQPRQMNRLRLANGERTEIVIDFTGLQDSVYYLMCYGTELGNGIAGGGLGGGNGTGGSNPYDSADYAMMEIRVNAPTNSPVAFDPSSTLTTITGWNEIDADTTRLIYMTGGVGVPFSFDSVTYDHHVINHTIKLGATEIWELHNNTFLGHPFHLHDVQFIVLDKDGLPPPLAEQGLKDVILVEAFSTMRFITQFADFADSTMPYMYHCHNLAHEDGGMMGQFIVIDTSSMSVSVATNDLANVSAVIYPNPSNGKISISTDKESNLKVYNSIGQRILSQTIYKGETELTLRDKGLLLFVFEQNGKQTIRKQLLVE